VHLQSGKIITVYQCMSSVYTRLIMKVDLTSIIKPIVKIRWRRKLSVDDGAIYIHDTLFTQLFRILHFNPQKFCKKYIFFYIKVKKRINCQLFSWTHNNHCDNNRIGKYYTINFRKKTIRILNTNNIAFIR